MKTCRVIPCVGTKIYYKAQIKGLFGWKDETESNKYAHSVFPSIESARDYLFDRHGSTTKIIDFVPK